MSEIKALLEEIDDRWSMTSKGPGSVSFTEQSDEEAIEAIRRSIQATRAYEKEHGLEREPFHFVEKETGEVVAHFGCGKTSKANALFWALCEKAFPTLRAHIERLEREVEAGNEAIEMIRNNSIYRAEEWRDKVLAILAAYRTATQDLTSEEEGV